MFLLRIVNATAKPALVHTYILGRPEPQVGVGRYPWRHQQQPTRLLALFHAVVPGEATCPAGCIWSFVCLLACTGVFAACTKCSRRTQRSATSRIKEVRFFNANAVIRRFGEEFHEICSAPPGEAQFRCAYWVSRQRIAIQVHIPMPRKLRVIESEDGCKLRESSSFYRGQEKVALSLART
ncbi:hypothetical protein J3F83DRAFT_313643 [Trichoderma novae-zelandiae]